MIAVIDEFRVYRGAVVWPVLSMGRIRQHNRIVLGQKALLISSGITLEVVIDDLSEDGVSVSTYSSKPLAEFGPETLLTLNFQPTTAETLSLQCRVKWVDKFLPDAQEVELEWK